MDGGVEDERGGGGWAKTNKLSTPIHRQVKQKNKKNKKKLYIYIIKTGHWEKKNYHQKKYHLKNKKRLP